MDNKKEVVIHFFELFIIVGAIIAGVYDLHIQIEKVEQRMEACMVAQDRRIDDLYMFILKNGNKKYD